MHKFIKVNMRTQTYPDYDVRSKIRVANTSVTQLKVGRDFPLQVGQPGRGAQAALTKRYKTRIHQRRSLGSLPALPRVAINIPYCVPSVINNPSHMHHLSPLTMPYIIVVI